MAATEQPGMGLWAGWAEGEGSWGVRMNENLRRISLFAGLIPVYATISVDDPGNYPFIDPPEDENDAASRDGQMVWITDPASENTNHLGIYQGESETWTFVAPYHGASIVHMTDESGLSISQFRFGAWETVTQSQPVPANIGVEVLRFKIGGTGYVAGEVVAMFYTQSQVSIHAADIWCSAHSPIEAPPIFSLEILRNGSLVGVMEFADDSATITFDSGETTDNLLVLDGDRLTLVAPTGGVPVLGPDVSFAVALPMVFAPGVGLGLSNPDFQGV